MSRERRKVSCPRCSCTYFKAYRNNVRDWYCDFLCAQCSIAFTTMFALSKGGLNPELLDDPSLVWIKEDEHV